MRNLCKWWRKQSFGQMSPLSSRFTRAIRLTSFRRGGSRAAVPPPAGCDRRCARLRRAGRPDDLLDSIRALLDADTCAILLLDEERHELVAYAARWDRGGAEQRFHIPVGKGFAGRVAAELRPVVLPDVEHADVLNPLIRRKGIASLVGVPLVVDGRPIGVLHVGTLKRRDFTREDVDLLQLAADRVAIALSHARAFEAERAARRRLEHVQAIVDASLAHLELDALLAELLDRIRGILGVDTCAVLLVDPERRDLVARALPSGLEEAVEQGIRIPLGKGFAGRIAAEGRPIGIARRRSRRRVQPAAAREGDQSLLGVPLAVGEHIIGVLHVGTLTPRTFTRDDTELLQLVAERLAGRDREGARPRRDDRARRAEAQLRRRRLARAAHAGDRGLRDPDDAARARGTRSTTIVRPPARADRLGAGRPDARA